MPAPTLPGAGGDGEHTYRVQLAVAPGGLDVHLHDVIGLSWCQRRTGRVGAPLAAATAATLLTCDECRNELRRRRRAHTSAAHMEVT